MALTVWLVGSQDPRVWVNGINRHTELLLEYLPQVGAGRVGRVSVLDRGALVYDLRARAVGRLFPPSARRLTEWRLKVDLLARSLRALPVPDVVHCQDVLAWMAARRALSDRVPTLLVHHAPDDPDREVVGRYGLDPGSAAVRWFREATLAAYREAEAVVAVSDASRPVAEHLRGGVVTVIQNGVRLPPPDAPPPPRPRDLPEGAVVAVGQLVPRKGPEVLRQAVGLLRRRDWWRPVVWIGDGPLGPALRAAERRAGQPLVAWLGRRPSPDAYLAHAWAFVLPSLEDNLPLAVLEAMARAVPVVASGVGGIPEAVIAGETGLLVPPGDPRALASALQRLKERPALAAAMGERGRRRVSERFGARDVARRYAQRYRDLAAATASGGDGPGPEPSAAATAPRK